MLLAFTSSTKRNFQFDNSTFKVDIMKTKTIKTPLMMAVAFGPTSCPSGFVLKSELLHNPEVQYGFVPQTSHHGGKNLALRAKKQISPQIPQILLLFWSSLRDSKSIKNNIKNHSYRIDRFFNYDYLDTFLRGSKRHPSGCRAEANRPTTEKDVC